MKIVKGKFFITISSELENVPENDINTLRFLLEEDLQDLGYNLEEIKICQDYGSR